MPMTEKSKDYIVRDGALWPPNIDNIPQTGTTTIGLFDAHCHLDRVAEKLNSRDKTLANVQLN